MSGDVRWMEQRANTLRREKGQILIEVLIALALLGVIATTFAGAMFTSLQAARVADERSAALTLSKSELEFAKQQSYSTNDWGYMVDTTDSYPLTGWDSPSWWGDATPLALSGTDFTGYSVEVTAASVDLDGTGGNDVGIRLLTATTFHDGLEIMSLENYEVDR